MNEKKLTKKDIEELYNTLLKLETVKDCEMLFADLCTNKEVEQMASRIKAAKMLIDGNTYSSVIEKIDISSATLSRVSKSVKYGKGYTKFLK